MIVTQEWLNASRTPKGGFTRLQLEYLDVPWPPKFGWQRSVIGKDISDETVRAFVAARLIRQSGVPYQTTESKPGLFAEQRTRGERIPRVEDNMPDVCEGMIEKSARPIKQKLFNPEKKLWK